MRLATLTKWLTSTQRAQLCVTIFVLVGNPPGFEFCIVAHSYSSRPFLCALGLRNKARTS